jgi:hypothetical protein
VGHGATARLGIFASDGQDLGDLLGGELARGTAPGSVAQQVLDRGRQRGRLLAALDQDQTRKRIGPAVPPGADRMTFTADMPGDILVADSIERQKDHPCPLGDGLRTSAGTDQSLEDGLLPFRDDELARPPWHHSDSWCSLVNVGGLEDYRDPVLLVED